MHAKHPGLFALVKPVDPADPAVAETIAAWAATRGAVGVRIMMNRDVSPTEWAHETSAVRPRDMIETGA